MRTNMHYVHMLEIFGHSIATFVINGWFLVLCIAHPSALTGYSSNDPQLR